MSSSEIIECVQCNAPVVASHGEPTICTNCFGEVIVWGASRYVGFPLSPERLKNAFIQEIVLCDEGMELYLARIKRQSEDVVLEKRQEYLNYHMSMAEKSRAERQRIKLKYICFKVPRCTMPSHNCSIKNNIQKSLLTRILGWWKDA